MYRSYQNKDMTTKRAFREACNSTGKCRSKFNCLSEASFEFAGRAQLGISSFENRRAESFISCFDSVSIHWAFPRAPPARTPVRQYTHTCALYYTSRNSPHRKSYASPESYKSAPAASPFQEASVTQTLS